MAARKNHNTPDFQAKKKIVSSISLVFSPLKNKLPKKFPT